MCGIFGILDLKNRVENQEIIKKMSHSLIHRGPDDCGYVFFELFGNQRLLESKEINELNQFNYYQGLLAFGHRRLSIIDLTETGHQPMCNEYRNIWIIYNGEIYNYIELRAELLKRGHIFKSKSDTEVIIHSYEEWGSECLNYFNGMWAFAIWDKELKQLFCARDRFGIKPFYFFFNGIKFIFASEIKAILQDLNIERYPNNKRVYDYLSYGYLDHTEETFFKNIYQLRGSQFLILNIENNKLKLQIKKYWDLERKENILFEEPEKRFLELFEDSIRLHMRSDVPIGTCLSGGLDSSSIVCVAKKFLNLNVHKTFSSCFEDKKYDEREYINKVIQITNSEPHFIFPSPQKLFCEIEDLIWYQEEPFGSTSVYAQWNVFRLAKEQGVKVVLDGQGADELLAGYHPFFGYYLSELGRKLQVYNFFREYKFIRSIYKYSHFWIIGHLLISLLPLTWSLFIRDQIHSKKNKWLKTNYHLKQSIEFKRKFKSIFYEQLYNFLMNFSLPGLLHYEDRNSMANSIEARVPFLDYRFVEFVFSLPVDQIIKNGTTKLILRKAMMGILPEDIRRRTDKMGFVTPQDFWFRKKLKNKIEEILNSKSFAQRGYFDVAKVKKYFEFYCNGKINIGTTIWRWVNLEIWFRIFIDNYKYQN